MRSGRVLSRMAVCRRRRSSGRCWRGCQVDRVALTRAGLQTPSLCAGPQRRPRPRTPPLFASTTRPGGLESSTCAHGARSRASWSAQGEERRAGWDGYSAGREWRGGHVGRRVAGRSAQVQQLAGVGSGRARGEEGGWVVRYNERKGGWDEVRVERRRRGREVGRAWAHWWYKWSVGRPRGVNGREGVRGRSVAKGIGRWEGRRRDVGS